MIYLVLIFCLSAALNSVDNIDGVCPDDKDKQITIVIDNPQQCLKFAQEQAALWLQDNPKYEFLGYECVVPKEHLGRKS
jgi:hypothetical protein